MENLALRFIRWGAGLLVLGLLLGYLPLGHYLMGDTTPSCPAAPVHGHGVLLGWVGMTLFGLVYRALPAWGGGGAPSLGLARAHFALSVVGALGVVVNGTLGYQLLDRVSRGFYYTPDRPVLHLWFAVDGLFLSLFGVGCVLFLVVLLRSTSYRRGAAAAA